VLSLVGRSLSKRRKMRRSGKEKARLRELLERESDRTLETGKREKRENEKEDTRAT